MPEGSSQTAPRAPSPLILPESMAPPKTYYVAQLRLLLGAAAPARCTDPTPRAPLLFVGESAGSAEKRKTPTGLAV